MTRKNTRPEAMKPCFAVEIITPKKYILDGFWFGPLCPKRVFVFIHGLGSSAFRYHQLVALWVDKKTAVMTFNNRGHDKIAKLRRLVGAKKSHVSILAGQAHEVFTDCADDIQGAVNFVKKQGAKEIYLAGHSTGCQKSVYYGSKKSDKAVKGLILLAPMSDYSIAVMMNKNQKLARAVKIARGMAWAGKKHDLMPRNICEDVIDAQRFLSLYTLDSAEEIFCYSQPRKNPVALKKIKLPMLVMLAEKDEYGDRPAEKIAAWFGKYINAKSAVKIIPGVTHGFTGGEKRVTGLVRGWIK